MVTHTEIKEQIAKNQVKLEQIVEMVNGIKNDRNLTKLEAMLIDSVSKLALAFRETLEQLSEVTD